MAKAFTEAVCALLEMVPAGFVVTYGSLAAAAGFPRSARQIVRILHTQSRSRNLPWHRVIAAGGRIALADYKGGNLQRQLLRSEGIEIGNDGRIDIHRYFWDFRKFQDGGIA